MGIVYIIGVVQAYFIVILLLNKKSKSLSDKILALWMFITGTHLLLFYLDFEGYTLRYPLILGIAVPLPLVTGPFLYLYVRTLISKSQKFKLHYFLHFIPALTYYAFLFPVYLMTREEQLSFIYDVVPVNEPLYITIFAFLIDLSGIVYIVWSLILLRNHKKFIDENFSFEENINLRWLRNVILGIALIWTIVLLGTLWNEIDFSGYVYIAVVIFIFLIGYFGIRQGSIFSNYRPSQTSEGTTDSPANKYQKSTLNSDQAKAYLEKLLEYMEQEAPYLESRLTLPQLALKLNVNSNHLSQVINENLDQNFYHFINGYRIKEFKERVESDTKNRYTLLAHASESGFSSKSSFNEVFKKITGITPSEYKRQLQSQV